MKKLSKAISIAIITIFCIQLLPISVNAITPFTSHPVYEGLANGGAHLSNIQFNDIGNHWAKEVIQEVSALSLMKGVNNTRFSPEGTLTYAEAITTLVRAIGKESEAQILAKEQLPLNVNGAAFVGVVEDWAKGYVQVAINEGILTQDQMAQITTWNESVTRQQVAIWLARALDVQPTYGENIVMINNFSDWKQIDSDKLPQIESLLQKGWMQGTSPTTFSPKGRLTRGQLAQLITNVDNELLAKRGMIQKTGIVIEKENVNQQGINKTIFTIENDDNSKNIIDIIPSQNKDFVLQKEGKLSLSSPLVVGNNLEYYINNNSQVVYGKIIPNTKEMIEGFIDYIDPDNHRLIVVDFEEKRHLLQGESFTTVETNGKPTSFKDLFYGQEVAVSLNGNKIKKIEGFLDVDPSMHGYIPPGSRTKVGKVLSISSKEIELTVDNNREKYKITADTEVIRGGGRANLFEIKQGDRVLLSFDDIYTIEVASIQVEDNEKHITALYRGTLDIINEKNKEIVLDKVSLYQNGSWVSHPDQKIKLKVEGQVLFSGGSPITLKDLEGRKGKETYVAAESSYGTERVAKLLLKEGSLVAYEDKISNVQYGNSQIVVDNNIFKFHPGTIVVKNNRLVDVLNLEKDQTVYLAGGIDKGAKSAAVVAIEYDGILDDRIDGTRLAIYRGRVEDIQDYGITIGRQSYYLDYLKLNNNTWSTMDRAKKLTLTEDSYVFDSDINKEIETDYLINSRFINPNDIKDPVLRNRIKNNYYIGKTAYVVVKETTVGGRTFEEVLSLNLTPNMPIYGGLVNIDHSAIGEIEGVDIDTGKVSIKNIKNWNTLSQKWESVKTPEEILLEKAVILLNDKPLNKDSLYLVGKSSKAYIIKSKNVSTGEYAYVVIVEQ